MQAAAQIPGLKRPGKPGGTAFVVVALLLLAGASIPAAASQVQFAKPVSGLLNPSGKPVTMSMPLSDGDRQLGDVVVLIGADDQAAISKSSLLAALQPVLDPAAADRLKGTPDASGNLGLDALKVAGFDISLEKSTLSLAYHPANADRGTGELSAGGGKGREQVASARLVEPATVSGYVNLRSSIDQTWGGGADGNAPNLSLDAQPVLRAGGVVYAGYWIYRSAAEPFICPLDAYCLNDAAGGVRRQYTRAIIENPEQLTRLEVGDTEAISTQYQTPIDTLGFSLQHSASLLAPNDVSHPTAGSSFRLDRPSEVDVVVNGAVVRHLQLAPGPYDLRDIPLQGGTNQVTLEITDDTGAHHTQTFAAVSDDNLLAAGKSEWAISGGVPSYLSDDSRVYRSNYLTGTGYYRLGLTNSYTGELEAQADNDVAEAGARLLAGLPVGFATFGTAVSTGRLGYGFGADGLWSLPNANIFLRSSLPGKESATLGVNYRSVDFHTPGEYIATSTSVIYPQYDYIWRFNGSYSVPLTDTATASFSGRYAIGNEAAARDPYTYAGNRFGLDVSIAAPVNSWLTGSVTAGYGNDSYLEPGSDKPNYHIGFRLTARPDEKSSVDVAYDSLSQDSTLTASRHSGNGVGAWDAEVEMDHNGTATNANGSLGYSGNRFDARISESSGFAGGLFGGAGQPSIQRTSASIGTAIGFAGGKVGWGAPVNGDAFAVVYPHESLAGQAVTVGSPDAPRAVADGWGPVIVGDLPARVPATLPVSVADLPLGYSLGQGGFDIDAPYHAGYALEVGSSYSVTAYGTLQAADGSPVALLTGTATPADGAGPQIAVFTNAAGRFGADGLAPGRWTIAMATEGGPTRFVLDIPPGTKGLFKAGTLMPAGG